MGSPDKVVVVVAGVVAVVVLEELVVVDDDVVVVDGWVVVADTVVDVEVVLDGAEVAVVVSADEPQAVMTITNAISKANAVKRIVFLSSDGVVDLSDLTSPSQHLFLVTPIKPPQQGEFGPSQSRWLA